MEKAINSNYNNFEEVQNNLKAVVIGASGAIGRELVKELMSSPKWKEVHLVVRRSLPDWKKYEGEKLKITEVSSLDVLQQPEDWNKFENFHSMFCTLGSRVQYGKEEFVKVDFTYVQFAGDIARRNNIPHFSLLSSTGADKNSFFLYTKTKGRTEEGIRSKQFPVVSIFRPGLLMNRDNDKRIGENILKYVPFMPKIEATEMGRAMRIEAELILERKNIHKSSEVNIYNNDQIKSLVKV